MTLDETIVAKAYRDGVELGKRIAEDGLTEVCRKARAFDTIARTMKTRQVTEDDGAFVCYPWKGEACSFGTLLELAEFIQREGGE